MIPGEDFTTDVCGYPIDVDAVGNAFVTTFTD